jgi:hypothetical protein
MFRVRRSPKLRSALRNLTSKASHSPDRFVPESRLSEWYTEYSKASKGYGRPVGSRNSASFRRWLRRTKKREAVYYAHDKAANLIENMLPR